MDDGVPRSVEGALLGIADRADTIAGMFGLGMEPTGSKDPFALRRAANGIVKILAETELSLTLGPVTSLVAKDEAEGALMRKFGVCDAKVRELSSQRAYRAALEAIATLRPEIDAFFDQVMVMDPDLTVRNGRLTLLAMIVASFSGIADFSEIVTAGSFALGS